MSRTESHTHHATTAPRWLIPPLFQIILICITSVILTLMLYHRLSIFKARDPMPKYHVINPKSFREFGSFANEMNVGLFIDEYENFNLSDNTFLFTGEIWFLFDPGIISLETLEKFSFAFGQILSRSEARTSLVNDKLFVRYNIRVQHSSTLDLTDFPLDNHHIFIQFQNQYISPSEILFVTNYRDFTAQSNSSIFGWDQRDLFLETGYQEDVLDPFDNKKTAFYPIVLFYIEYKRSSIQQIITIFLPLLLIFYVILFSFTIRETSTSISLSAGSVTGILAYRFVIANISPKVGYFMLSDYLFFLFLAVSTFIFLMNISDIYYHKLRLFAKKIFLICVHIFINIATAYLLFA